MNITSSNPASSTLNTTASTEENKNQKNPSKGKWNRKVAQLFKSLAFNGRRLVLLLKPIVKTLEKLIVCAVIFFVLASFTPLRDIIPNFYVLVDGTLECFDALCSFILWLFGTIFTFLFGLFG